MRAKKKKLSSPHLIHFTPKLELLVSILKNGFEYRNPKERLPLTGYSTSPLSIPGVIRYDFTWPVVCFCDIPEHAIRDHSNQYGRYGICLKKEWGITSGVTPIRYIHYYTPDFNNNVFYTIRDTLSNLRHFDGSFTGFITQVLKDNEGIEIPTEEEWNNLPEKFKKYFAQIDLELIPILTHTLRYLGLVRIYEDEWRDRVTEKLGNRIFYDEKEWRALKLSVDQENLKFTESDIVAIIVDRKNDKERLYSFFVSETDNNMVDIEKIRNRIFILNEYVKSHT